MSNTKVLTQTLIDEFTTLLDTEEAWRIRVLHGEETYSEKADLDFTRRLQGWHARARRYGVWLKAFERRNHLNLANSGGRLLTCIKEAEGILTDDAEFFAGDALVELRDAAIEEVRARRSR